MTFPKISIRLFPPRDSGKRYMANGAMQASRDDMHAFARWILQQEGEYDDYLGGPSIRVPAFLYENQSKSGSSYMTVQLVDLDGQQSGGQQAGGRPPARAQQPAPEELPF